MDFLITGCGRSGTKYVAERLNSSGISCGHEKIFTVYGPSQVDFDKYDGDSSWFAAPFLEILPTKLPVLHIVRNPVKVVKSFYRIGLCSKYIVRQFCKGRNLLSIALRYNIKKKKILKRYHYVMAHRRLLGNYTSCMTKSNEIDRLWDYWYQWNKMIEEKATRCELTYLRVTLETIDQLWPNISEFLKIGTPLTPGVPVNTKPRYRRKITSLTPPPKQVIDLAYNYGYRHIVQEAQS